MSSMTHAELRQVMENMAECDRYLQGQTCGSDIRSLADHAAKRAVMERKANMLDRLREAGLNLVDAEV